jgi:uncharacterized damage-inducible protein DinB
MNSRAEISRIEDQLRRSMEGPAWVGPCVLDLLKEVPIDLAPAKPLEHAHSIWEIVLHIAAWQRTAARRLQGETVELSPAEDWPPVPDVSEAAWKQAIKNLRESYEALKKSIAKLGDDKLLATKVPNREHDYYFLLHGIIQHNFYHAGQIGVLKKSSR